MVRTLYSRGTIQPQIFLLIFGILQVADIVTTNRALALPGRVEINPLMVQAMSAFGPAWWVPKAAIVALVALTALWAADRQSRILAAALVAAITITLAVVTSNIAHL